MSRKHQQYSGVGQFIGRIGGGIIVYLIIAFLVSLLVLKFTHKAHATDTPKTNGERGMLKYNDSFGPNPKIKLCEVKENDIIRLRTCTNAIPPKDECLPPDCSWLNTKNGDLTPSTLPGIYDVAHYWRGWLDYERKVRDICSRPGNACTQGTRGWLQRE